MTNPEEKNYSPEQPLTLSPESSGSSTSMDPEKGPISFLSGSITSGFLCWICFLISKRVVIYFALHSSQYSSPFAQSVASGFKTLIEGICFLATFTFGFIGIGLMLVFIRSIIHGNKEHSD